MKRLLEHITAYHAVMDGTSTRHCLEFLDAEEKEIHRVADLMPASEREAWRSDDLLLLKEMASARSLLLARLQALAAEYS
jgi:hypothetical protein